RHERPERASLVAVDEVDRIAAAVEAEDSREELRAEAACLQLRPDEVDGVHEVFELRVADDEPRIAERVLRALDPRAGVAGDGVEELPQVALRLVELPGGERLEDDRRDARGPESELGIER